MRAWATGIWAAALILQFAIVPANAGPTLLFEPSTGKILYAEDVDDLWHPASLTKIMTAYIAFEAIKEGKLHLDDKISCSLRATLQPPSKAGIQVGNTLTVEQALQAVIVKSANDVTVMLAEAISGSEAAFVDRMNATAKRLGMTRTHFVNTNGLPEPDLVTTARDLGKLARAVITEYPQYASYWSMPAMHIGKRRLGSHNALLRTFPGADGLKTGFTCDSGYNVIASASRDGRRLLAVVLGETSGNERAIRSASLLEYGFQNYDWKQLFNTTNLDTLPVDPSAKGITSVRDTVAAWSCRPPKQSKSGATARHKRRQPKATAAKSQTAAKKGNEASESPPPVKGAEAAIAPQPQVGATAKTPKSAQAISP
jgi:D-alanyl-D-alanine carboxypeptidase